MREKSVGSWLVPLKREIGLIPAIGIPVVTELSPSRVFVLVCPDSRVTLCPPLSGWFGQERVTGCEASDIA